MSELSDYIRMVSGSMERRLEKANADRDRYRQALEGIVRNLGSPSYQANPSGNGLLLEDSLRRAREALGTEKERT